MLLPCQFSLLNGDTNTADVDGMDFNGTRPTTISATISYNTTAETNEDIGTFGGGGNDGINMFGVDTPIGTGRGDIPGQCDAYSLMMLAKVSPPAATNITYGWDRKYYIRAVTISQTSTNTWDVRGHNYSTGPMEDTGANTYYTTTPSTNNNVVIFYDNPALNISQLSNNAPNVGDYAYQKFGFTYYLTNSIGSTNAVATQQVGVVTLAQRISTNNVVSTDWTNIYNIASTTNFPDCSGVTSNEISAIVYPSTNRIIIESSATYNYP
jgi:hypothetical protein